jgi:hypothetical protein
MWTAIYAPRLIVANWLGYPSHAGRRQGKIPVIVFDEAKISYKVLLQCAAEIFTYIYVDVTA